MNTFFKLLLFILLLCTLSSCENARDTKTITIGIVEPLSHRAMDEIIQGFSNTLKNELHTPFKVKVENAQSDINLQRAILQKMQNANYDFIVPIGSSATDMALSMIHTQNIISLAADLSEKTKNTLKPCNIALVHDEIDANHLVNFIHLAYPNIKNLFLIHSASDKVFAEVAEIKKAAKGYGIQIKTLMISNLSELYTAASQVSKQTEGVLILKDSLVVSGIATLVKMTNTSHIPLITSDEGSIQDGGDFALGVHEKEIGVLGAKLLIKVLNGIDICTLPAAKMNQLTVFLNKKSLEAKGIFPNAIIDAANKLHYTIEVIH